MGGVAGGGEQDGDDEPIAPEEGEEGEGDAMSRERQQLLLSQLHETHVELAEQLADKSNEISHLREMLKGLSPSKQQVRLPPVVRSVFGVPTPSSPRSRSPLHARVARTEPGSVARWLFNA